MGEWKKTSCVLCFSNCGLEVTTEGSRILKVRGDKEDPRSQGYICRKGANIAYFQNNPERLRYPLKRVGGRYERISWKQALDEIAALANKDYPMILMAGNHMEMVANSIMRDPAWNEGRRSCTLRIHPEDARTLGIADKDTAIIETEAGSATAEAEVTESSHRGQVVIPHGFGLVHGGKAHGVNVNRLAPASHRDRFAATPLHRYIPCRVRKA